MNRKLNIAVWFRSCLFVIVLSYSCFMGYACKSQPQIPTSPAAVTELSPKSSEQISDPSGVSTLEIYINQITSFYQQLITFLLGIIGVLLGVNFIYLHTTSKIKAEEMAHEAMETKSFGYRLKVVVDEKLNELKSSGDFADIFDKVDDFQERIEYLEGELTRKSYEGVAGDTAKLEVKPDVVAANLTIPTPPSTTATPVDPGKPQDQASVKSGDPKLPAQSQSNEPLKEQGKNQSNDTKSKSEG